MKPTLTLNSSDLDTTTSEGIRVSLPCYVDPPMNLRKNILNLIRTECNRFETVEQPRSQSGIVVSHSQSQATKVDQYLGLSVEHVLRGVLFSRGGMPIDLILRLQEVAGVKLITEEEIIQAFDQRKQQVLDYVKHHPYNRSAT
jgi:hypothetical protein